MYIYAKCVFLLCGIIHTNEPECIKNNRNMKTRAGLTCLIVSY